MNRWAVASLGVLNEGLDGNRLLHDELGPNGLSRFERDVLSQPGLAYVIVLAAANGPSGERDSGRETVKLGIGGHEIEIPHFSMASSVAFPKEVFRFCYTYYRSDQSHPSRLISAITHAGCRSPAKPRIRSRQ